MESKVAGAEEVSKHFGQGLQEVREFYSAESSLLKMNVCARVRARHESRSTDKKRIDLVVDAIETLTNCGSLGKLEIAALKTASMHIAKARDSVTRQTVLDAELLQHLEEWAASHSDLEIDGWLTENWGAK